MPKSIFTSTLLRIELSWEDEEWFQDIDYKQIPFRCRRCHENGHLYKECPENNPTNMKKGKETKDAEGFTKVIERKIIAKRNQGPEVNKKPSSYNPFDGLKQENMHDNQNKTKPFSKNNKKKEK